MHRTQSTYTSVKENFLGISTLIRSVGTYLLSPLVPSFSICVFSRLSLAKESLFALPGDLGTLPASIELCGGASNHVQVGVIWFIEYVERSSNCCFIETSSIIHPCMQC